MIDDCKILWSKIRRDKYIDRILRYPRKDRPTLMDFGPFIIIWNDGYCNDVHADFQTDLIINQNGLIL